MLSTEGSAIRRAIPELKESFRKLKDVIAEIKVPLRGSMIKR